jgi:hypothetical protein
LFPLATHDGPLHFEMPHDIDSTFYHDLDPFGPYKPSEILELFVYRRDLTGIYAANKPYMDAHGLTLPETVGWSIDSIETMITVVPEPTTVCLLGLGVLSLRRRSRN